MAKKPSDKPKPKPKGKKKKTTLQIVEVARPGKYRIHAPDLLQSIALREKLQEKMERLKKSTKTFIERGLENGSLTKEDVQEIVNSVQEVDGAVVPIAYGVFEGEDPDGDGDGDD